MAIANARARGVLAGRLLVGASLLCSACGRPTPSSLDRPLSSFAQEITSPLKRLRMRPNQPIQLPVVVKNIGPENWVSQGTAPVMLSYKWFANETMLPAEGERTTLPGVLRPGETVPLQMRIVAPERTGSVVLAVTLVQEGVAWFLSSGGSALRIPVQLEGNASAHSNEQFSQQITSSVHNLSVSPGEKLTIPVTVKNTCNRLVSTAGKFPVTFSYKWFDGGTMLGIEGERTFLPRPLNPGDEVSFAAKVVAPAGGQHLTLKLTLVQEGVAWFMTSGGTPLEIPVKMK